MYVSQDKKRAVVYFIVRSMRPSNEIVYLKLKALIRVMFIISKIKNTKGAPL